MKDPKSNSPDYGVFIKHSLSKNDIKSVKTKLAHELKQEGSIRFAFLHGSFIEGKPFRDIDIAIYLDQTAVDSSLDICNRLSVNLTDKIGFPVDVHPLNNASLGFCYYAVQGEMLICRNREEAYEFKENIYIKYMDFYPFLKENLADLLR